MWVECGTGALRHGGRLALLPVRVETAGADVEDDDAEDSAEGVAFELAGDEGAGKGEEDGDWCDPHGDLLVDLAALEVGGGG